MFDWNGNGKEDWGDRYIDYQVYKDVMGENDDDDKEPSGGEGAGCGCLSPIIGFFLIFMIWNIMTN